MQKIPQDPVMCVSFVNTKLRDFFPDLEALCDSLEIQETELVDRLGSAGFVYQRELNQFR